MFKAMLTKHAPYTIFETAIERMALEAFPSYLNLGGKSRFQYFLEGGRGGEREGVNKRVDL